MDDASTSKPSPHCQTWPEVCGERCKAFCGCRYRSPGEGHLQKENADRRPNEHRLEKGQSGKRKEKIYHVRMRGAQSFDNIFMRGCSQEVGIEKFHCGKVRSTSMRRAVERNRTPRRRCKVDDLRDSFYNQKWDNLKRVWKINVEVKERGFVLKIKFENLRKEW